MIVTLRVHHWLGKVPDRRDRRAEMRRRGACNIIGRHSLYVYTPMNISSSLLRPGRKARIEIIPLIDVVFFLLATFVLFTLSLEKIVVVDPQLPMAGRPERDDETVYIQATGQGKFLWKRGRSSAPELISAAELPVRLVNYNQTVRQARVFICGDNQVKFGSAVMLIDEVRRAKIKQISMETSAQSSIF